MDVDWGDGYLEPRPQAQEESAHIELPGLGRRHQEGPADEEGHDGEGEQRGLPAHSVHQEDGGERAKQGSDTEKAA